jgi:mannosyl-oligosaccharide alpha-1,2-mannosidase
MIRRKIRPLSVLAFVAVLLLFQFLRRGGKEVFMLDTLPPYTDTDDYVKKPVPPKVPNTLPPPPPADWFRDRQDVLEESRLRPQTPNGRVREPAPPAPKNPPQRANSEQQRTAYDDSTPRLPPSRENEHEHSHAPPPDTHHEDDHAVPNQPPAPGDVHTGGSRQSTRILYSADDLAPRVVRNPIPPNSLIVLPKIKPVTFPKVQARYPAESAEHKRIRLQRQSAIKRAMIRSWEAYSTYAMGHDEVRPVSGRYNDPFCGWGATLVDSLDTLQIMGMQAEYEAALEYIKTIDFSHTTSYRIPLFETVIRYLGGLLGAYDVSNGKDTILLDKAKDLADMLMGSFDTINRMPLLRYDWRPQSALVGMRASQDACLAEIGTLSMEFTRLAQLTGNDTYYDAVHPGKYKLIQVQRITDEFEDFQFSHIPGLFPLHVDASGCRHHEVEAQPTLNDQLNTESHYGQSTGGQQAQHQKRQLNEHTHVQDESHLEDPGRANMGNAMRESLSDTTRQPAGQPQSSWQAPATNPIEICERQGFTPSLCASY